MSVDKRGINLLFEGKINGELVKIGSELHPCLLEQDNIIATEVERLIKQFRYAQKEHTKTKS